MNYDVNYFIEKFSKIPESCWHVGGYSDGRGASCALGHCGLDYSHENKRLFGCPYGEEQAALYKVFGESFDAHMKNENTAIVARINDGYNDEYQQPTPKQRILAALYDIKKLQEKESQPQYTDITKQLAVLPQQETSDLKHQSQELILQ